LITSATETAMVSLMHIEPKVLTKLVHDLPAQCGSELAV